MNPGVMGYDVYDNFTAENDTQCCQRLTHRLPQCNEISSCQQLSVIINIL